MSKNRMFKRSHKGRTPSKAEKKQLKSEPTSNQYVDSYIAKRRGLKASKLFSQLYRKFDDNVANALTSNAFCNQKLLDSIMATRSSGGSAAYDFKYQYLKEEIFSKYVDPLDDGGVTDEERWQKGYEKLMVTEHRCKSINAHGFEFRDSSALCK